MDKIELIKLKLKGASPKECDKLVKKLIKYKLK